MKTFPLEKYQKAIASGEFTHDDMQEQAMTYLDNICQQLVKTDCGAVLDVVKRG